MGLIDEQSGAVTPDFLELQESLPIIRRSTWDQESVKRKKKEKGERMEEVGVRGGREEVLVEGDEDVVYQERRRTDVDDDLEEVRNRLQVFYTFLLLQTQEMYMHGHKHCTCQSTHLHM